MMKDKTDEMASRRSGYDGDDERQRPTPRTKKMAPKTVTKTETAPPSTVTTYQTKTVVSERWMAETTVMTEHWRTKFQDHWTTITPPTKTETVIHTAYVTTVTMPARTIENYHYVPCSDEVIVLKHCGRFALLAWFIFVAYLIYIYRRRRRLSRYIEEKVV